MEIISWFWEGGICFIRVPNVNISGTKLGPSEIHLSYWEPYYWNRPYGETEWTEIDSVVRLRRISLLEIENRTCLIVGRAAFVKQWIGIRCVAVINSILPCV